MEQGHHIGILIRIIRKRQGKSIRGLAKELGIADRSLGRIEVGESYPSWKTLCHIAEHMGIQLHLTYEEKRLLIKTNENEH
jgi:transcriptional regulator with XRE-family HTH domain